MLMQAAPGEVLDVKISVTPMPEPVVLLPPAAAAVFE
jgi:hypothetical protein